ncbi:6-phosphofructokinase [Candidatus Desantisbacteria bacterium]|nr:6-phosphofructokinase [Candidatus Desantisbacteria bacterium]
MVKRIGILTGGGDCPGLNAAIRAIVRKGISIHGYEIFGILNGWAGLLDGKIKPLGRDDVSGILHKGGTIIGTSRTNPYKRDDGVDKIKENMKISNLESIIAIGGEDTLGVAAKLIDEGIKVVGVPKTIDNDLKGTQYTFGFDTAVSIITEAIDRLHSTAEAHHRVIVLEVMGRHAGWLAVVGGIAGGADLILIPEEPFDINGVCEVIKRRHQSGRDFSLVVVSEGAKEKEMNEITSSKRKDEFGHEMLGGIGNVLSKKIEKITGFETRVTVLGHTQRGGTPTAFDRVLATRYGIAAIDLIAKDQYGFMVALVGGEIKPIPLKEMASGIKTVDMELYEIAKVFFG